MSELTGHLRISFTAIEPAVALKHLLRRWSESVALRELVDEFEPRLPEVTLLADRVDTLLNGHYSLTEQALRAQRITFEGNRDAVFYFELPQGDHMVLRAVADLLFQWLSTSEHVTEVVKIMAGDEIEFEARLGGDHVSLDSGGSPDLYDWLAAQVDGELPGERYDIPQLYLASGGNLEAAKLTGR